MIVIKLSQHKLSSGSLKGAQEKNSSIQKSGELAGNPASCFYLSLQLRNAWEGSTEFQNKGLVFKVLTENKSFTSAASGFGQGT